MQFEANQLTNSVSQFLRAKAVVNVNCWAGQLYTGSRKKSINSYVIATQEQMTVLKLGGLVEEMCDK